MFILCNIPEIHRKEKGQHVTERDIRIERERNIEGSCKYGIGLERLKLRPGKTDVYP
jgi:hypothetical protein